MIVNDLNDLDLGYALQVRTAVGLLGSSLVARLKDDAVRIIAIHGELPRAFSLQCMKLCRPHSAEDEQVVCGCELLETPSDHVPAVLTPTPNQCLLGIARSLQRA